ncbi:carboxylesterase/lipase family protein [Clostridium saccharoperbutylacetonicum]|uniref:carboxylesterase/lipase family protein n=1 Tax=Clostridium saccharoperbutylacetonicum TaxID=36745 RepID=UPI000983C334|nr:carboxylesterase family protein [Clostridium saccharoperbutylacetonicum]AQR97303.1 fumonisin B1 esterase [Clostridium saccharoperbutylacetonicum]NSB33186.1 para-nitrobenzyl esterase [Clostridium saccharoperbutylacetonicum]
MLRRVKVENGIVQGLPAADPRITSFKGIPFAAPPVGENRWRAPKPAKDWEGVLKAFEFAPISMQAQTVIDDNNIYTREWAVDPDIPMDEDCLYLNVWTPACNPNEKLPVFVWYFGGALQFGNTAEMEFDGERIARRGVVVVTVNYRLNVLGFLCHPEITAEAPEAPANFGNLDQRAGTLWVKRNIEAFGGDPNNITIGGQSAGGGSVMTQITSPQNEGFCQKAIIESGIITTLYKGNPMPLDKYNLAEAEQEGIKFFEFLGVSSLSEARKLDAKYIRDKSVEYKKYWGTVHDNVFCVGDALELFIKNKRLMVPVLFGHTSSEFFNVPKVKNIDEFKEMAFEMFGDAAEEYLKLCKADQSANIEEVIEKASVSSIEYGIHIIWQANGDTNANSPLYYYNFDAKIPGWDNPGTFHSVDLWFFFETLAKCWRPFTGKHYDLARQMCNYWTNFICSGNPNGKDATGEDMPHWESYTTEMPYGMVFGEKAEFIKEQPSDLMKFLVKEYFKKEKNL